MQPKLQVIYDISLLGVGHLHSDIRTGSARVVEHLAYGLAGAEDCQLAFCCRQSLIDACAGYLQSNATLQRVPLLYADRNPAIRRLGALANHYLIHLPTTMQRGVELKAHLAHGRWGSFARELKLPARILGQLSVRTQRSLDKLAPVPAKSLAEARIYHSPNEIIPDQVRHCKHLKRLVTIYDAIPLILPELFTPSILRTFDNLLASLAPDDWILSISESTKNDLCSRANINPDRVIVTPIAASPELFHPCEDGVVLEEARRKYKIPEGPYVLSLNTLEPRKNIDKVIHAFAQLVQQEKINDLSLVLVGAKGWLYGGIFETLSQYPMLNGRIIITGHVADSDLAALYSGATVFVYLSQYEGFGLPPLEAMQCGTPVITSNTSSLPEVVGAAGITVAPDDTDKVCQSMLIMYRDPAARASFSQQSLEQAGHFSWERCVRDVIGAYRTALAA